MDQDLLQISLSNPSRAFGSLVRACHGKALSILQPNPQTTRTLSSDSLESNPAYTNIKATMSSQFYLSSPTSSNNSDSDFDDTYLPFPRPLARQNFLTPDFDPATFLASLTNRFQTLEDLQTELRTLSITIQTELVDLVNDNYEEFLNLGEGLRGGEERIEEVRVGLMGVERELEGLREKVDVVREEVRRGMETRRGLGREIERGRGLLDLERRVEELEGSLGLGERKEKEVRVMEMDGEEDWGNEFEEVEGGFDEDDGEEEIKDGQVPRRLERRIEQWLCIKHLVGKYDAQHPFLVAEQTRLRKLKETMLLDIDAGIRAHGDIRGKQKLLELRREVDD